MFHPIRWYARAFIRLCWFSLFFLTSLFCSHCQNLSTSHQPCTQEWAQKKSDKKIVCMPNIPFRMYINKEFSVFRRDCIWSVFIIILLLHLALCYLAKNIELKYTILECVAQNVIKLSFDQPKSCNLIRFQIVLIYFWYKFYFGTLFRMRLDYKLSRAIERISSRENIVVDWAHSSRANYDVDEKSWK